MKKKKEKIENRWRCGKCDQEKNVIMGEIIPNHFRTCQKKKKEKIEHTCKTDPFKKDCQECIKLLKKPITFWYTDEKGEMIFKTV